MNKKGFTLIELLAVIIILAVIALIATPIVLDVINDARLKSAESSVNGYISAVDNARYEYILDNNGAEPTWSDISGDVSVKGETVVCYGTGTDNAPTLTNGVFAATKCSTMTGSGNDATAKYTCQITNSLATNCKAGDKYNGES